MNTVFIHSDLLEFEVKKKTKLAVELTDDLKKNKVTDCLVCFMAFELADDEKEEALAEKFVLDVIDVLNQIKEKRIVLYPYAHLLFGKKPSKPETAINSMNLIQKKLEGNGFEVFQAPFGWYKAFTIKSKGHPLSELSREIIADKEVKQDVSEAVKKEEKLKSNWFVLDLNGKLNPLKVSEGTLEGFDFKGNENLKTFANYEINKSRKADQEPPHVKLMKQLGLADYELGSDPGNLRYPPKGKMVKALIEELVTKTLHENGAMEIESPIMFDFEHPSLKSYLNRFPARQYTIETPNKKVFLRFAACFGQFLMMHDTQVSYKDLPIWLYELAKYSFRVEQRGELTGLRRLRAFTMPDCHAFCADLEQAKEQYIKRFEMSRNVMHKIGFNVSDDLEFALRVVKPFWNEHKEFISDLVKRFGKPALIEMWEEQFFYFALKYEWNFVDALSKASALTTDQIDVENAQRYKIEYTDKNGKKQFPFILHLSPSGAIERVLYALLEKAYMQELKGKVPSLPLWLSPTQVRIIPINESHLDFALKLSEKIEAESIRADVDDRNESLSKKIREAGREWVPYLAVIGDKEINSKNFSVRIRENNLQKDFSLESLVKEIKLKTEKLPFRQIPLPKMLSKRPTFVQ